MKSLASLLLTVLLTCCAANAKPPCNFTPVFYGTLLEFASSNNTPGELSLQPYVYGGACFGAFNNNWHVEGSGFGVISPELFIYLGITKHVQLAGFIESQTVWYKGHSSTAFSDSSFGLGWQFLWDQKGTPIPNLRVDTLGIFPTGKYRNLEAQFEGVNATGFGSYGAVFALVLDKTFYPNPCHPININFSTGYAYLSKTSLRGINTYGGTPDTNGTYHPGGRTFAFLSIEYYLTSLLNLALDIQYVHSFSSSFHGYPGAITPEIPGFIFTDSADELILCPALEIGFNPQMALFIGAYVTATGRNVYGFAEGVMSFVISF